MAKKKVAKKVAKKAPAKKATKKVAKKTVKKAAKKAPAKKAPAKKAAVKKVVKKAAVKKVTKKTAVKKVAKKAPTKVTAEKIIEIKQTLAEAPVVAAPVVQTPAKKQGGSNRVVLAVIIGILAIGAIVVSKGTDSTETATPTENTSATPTASEVAPEPTPTEEVITTIAEPLGIVAHYTADGATIFWDVTTATDGLKGYSVEFSSSGGPWTEVATVGVDVTTYDITKSDSTGWTSFKISAVYNDGQKAEGKVFGLPGQYK